MITKQRSRSRRVTAAERAGEQAGLSWAKQRAKRVELRRLAARVSAIWSCDLDRCLDHDGGAFLGGLFLGADADLRDGRDYFELKISEWLGEHANTPAALHGFIDGALQVADSFDA
jgi:hypothetical protein